MKIDYFFKSFLLIYCICTFFIFFHILYSSDSSKCHTSKQCTIKTKSCKLVPTLYIITPTYTRLTQKAELTRLVHTFKLVNCIHWLVVEDAETKSELVDNLLIKSELSFTLLQVLTPSAHKLQSTDPRWKKARGVLQRNEGLKWIRSNNISEGVVYFADDDNTYDLQLFEEMRLTKKVSVWPVGLVGKLKYESPLLDEFGKVVGWRTKWKTHRTFAMDMAGFAVNVKFLSQTQAFFSHGSFIGELENDFLSQFTTLDDLEAMAKNCSKILVWHTQSKDPSVQNEVYFTNRQHNIDIEI